MNTTVDCTEDSHAHHKASFFAPHLDTNHHYPVNAVSTKVATSSQAHHQVSVQRRTQVMSHKSTIHLSSLSYRYMAHRIYIFLHRVYSTLLHKGRSVQRGITFFYHLHPSPHKFLSFIPFVPLSSPLLSPVLLSHTLQASILPV